MAFWAKAKEPKSAPDVPSNTALSPVAPAGDAESWPSSFDSPPPTSPITQTQSVAGALGDIVMLLMQSPEFRSMPISALEVLVLPALATGQFMVANARANEGTGNRPVAVVLWASVSDDIDLKMSEAKGQPISLTAADIQSGPNLWLTLAAGDSRVLDGMFQHLKANQWGGHPVKYLARRKDEHTQAPLTNAAVSDEHQFN